MFFLVVRQHGYLSFGQAVRIPTNTAVELYANKKSRPHNLELLFTSRGSCYLKASHQEKQRWKKKKKEKHLCIGASITSAEQGRVSCGKHSASGSFTIDVINYKAQRTKLVHMKNENVPERRGRTKHSLVLFSQQRWKVCFYHKMLVKMTCQVNDWKNCLHIGPLVRTQSSLSRWPICSTIYGRRYEYQASALLHMHSAQSQMASLREQWWALMVF